LGLVHLYSLASERMPDPDDLEFTLAVADNLALALRNLGRQQELADNVSQQQNEIRQLRHLLGAECELIGSSEALQKVHLDIARAAPSRATVLIRGESGVGQGTGGAGDSLRQPPQERSLRLSQLRGTQ
jgi:transcriptional regulator with GAF, ATPase, and Fis domain